MLTVETRHAIHPEHAKGMDTEELRRHFLAQDLFRDGEIRRSERMCPGMPCRMN